MAEHIWSILCNKSIIDRDGNQVTLVAAMEQLNIHSKDALDAAASSEVPAILPFEMSFVTLWTRSDPNQPESGQARLTLYGPAGMKISLQEFEVDLGDNLRFRTRVQLPGLAFRGLGVYHFQVDQRKTSKTGRTSWRKVAKVPLEVCFKPKPKTPEPPPN